MSYLPEIVATAIILKCISDACWNFYDITMDRKDRSREIILNFSDDDEENLQ